MSFYNSNTTKTSFDDEITCKREKSLFEMGFGRVEAPRWNETIQPKKSDLLTVLDRMTKNYDCTNIEILIGDSIFKCHTIVLQAYSKYFREQINGRQQMTLPESNVSANAFRIIYDWMLSPEPTVQRQGILEVFSAGCFLLIKELVEQCWTCFDSDKNFIEDSAFCLYLDARTLGEPLIMELMINRISRFFLTLVASKEFLEFETKEVIDVLQSSMISVHWETEVFFSVIRWLFHDYENRKIDLVKVMRCVRFGLIPPWHLVEFERDTNCHEIRTVMQDPDVHKMVTNGLHYVISTNFQGKFSNGDLNAVNRLELDIPNERLWIEDKLSDKYASCAEYWQSSYTIFLEYLNMLRDAGSNYWKSMDYVDKPIHLADEGRFKEEVDAIGQSFVKHKGSKLNDEHN